MVFFGDSIFALSGEIQKNLHAYAGKTFRNYTTSGAELSGGIIQPSVEQQFQMAEADNPNSTVIVMDGGGNDILIPALALDPYDCRTQWYEFGKLSSRCKSFMEEIYVDGVDRAELPRKSNFLCVGPTGSGKTFLVETLFGKILKLPTALVDIMSAF